MENAQLIEERMKQAISRSKRIIEKHQLTVIQLQSTEKSDHSFFFHQFFITDRGSFDYFNPEAK
jgi:hypothetical protein